MKKLFFLFALLIGVAAIAQTRVFEGDLHVGETSLPLEIGITPAHEEVPATVTLTSLSQLPTPIPCQVLALSADTLSFVIPQLGITYEANIYKNLIRGTFTQNGFPFQLDLLEKED